MAKGPEAIPFGLTPNGVRFEIADCCAVREPGGFVVLLYLTEDGAVARQGAASVSRSGMTGPLRNVFDRRYASVGAQRRQR